ncbi:MAG: chromosome segregation protein SMC [Nitrospirae bacterium]|nr:chromosome segregation protein SMC [Nitrospirota bacterium]
MKILSLELNGFKSFSDKTTFTMHSGITCIVGPNGCGKSNVVDAFRWVLGEQSAKNLRGDKMEEVIFAGTSETKPKGMTDVTLTFVIEENSDNGNGDSGTQQTVEITRRLFRNGDSEYLINKKRNRLKDVREMFLDTGLEVKSYSILEQGRISEILNTKPTERRFLIEEVAGVMKYKVRKTEALAKLERAQVNLDRVNDIIAEIKRSMNSLEKQAKKAELFKSLTAEHNTIELKLAKRDFEALHNDFLKVTEESAAVNTKLTEITASISSLEEQRKSKSQVLFNQRNSLEAMTEELQKLEKEISELEKNIALKKASIKNSTSHTERLMAQESDYSTERDDAIDSLERLTGIYENLETEINSTEAGINEENKLIASFEKTLAETEDEIRDKNKKLFQISESMGNAKNELSTIQTLIASLTRKKESSTEFLKRAVDDIQAHDTQLKSMETDLERKKSAFSEKSERKANLKKELEDVEKSVDSLREEISSVREKLAAASSRLTSLLELTTEDKNTKEFTELFNPLTVLSEVLTVDGQYETAIESAISEKIKGYVISSKESLIEAVRFINNRGWEKTALFTVDFISEASPEKPPAFSEHVTDPLSVVSTPDKYLPLIKAVLNDFLIVDNLDTAFKLLTDSGKGKYYVTLEGDVLEPSGAVLCGKRGTVLRHLRNIRELRSEVNTLKETLTALETRQKETLTKRETLKSDILKTEQTLLAFDKDIAAIKSSIRKCEDEKERYKQRLALMQIESGETDKEIADLRLKAAEMESRLAVVSKSKVDTETYIGSLRESAVGKRTQLERLRASLMDKKMTVTKQRERLRAAKNEEAALNRKIETLESKIQSVSNEMEALSKKTDKAALEVVSDEETLTKLSEKDKELRDKIKQQRELISGTSTELRDFEKQALSLRSDSDRGKERLNELNLKGTEDRLKMENIEHTIYTAYGKGLDELNPGELSEGDEESLPLLKQKIRDIGPVNLSSIEEYEELKTRYDFLTTQQADIVTSISELREVISKINHTTKQRLSEAFMELNTKFNETFRSFFGGGYAELILTDPLNILESGIDIVVQPPYKKLQNINLLSGGEKALSAISLVFAGFVIKPTPLCILDEADAALDEANTKRFTEMIVKMSEKTQFIVITHNRTTMEMANYIYGITAETPGVSKVISVEFAKEELQVS